MGRQEVRPSSADSSVAYSRALLADSPNLLLSATRACRWGGDLSEGKPPKACSARATIADWTAECLMTGGPGEAHMVQAQEEQPDGSFKTVWMPKTLAMYYDSARYKRLQGFLR